MTNVSNRVWSRSETHLIENIQISGDRNHDERIPDECSNQSTALWLLVAWPSNPPPSEPPSHTAWFDSLRRGARRVSQQAHRTGRAGFPRTSRRLECQRCYNRCIISSPGLHSFVRDQSDLGRSLHKPSANNGSGPLSTSSPFSCSTPGSHCSFHELSVLYISEQLVAETSHRLNRPITVTQCDPKPSVVTESDPVRLAIVIQVDHGQEMPSHLPVLPLNVKVNSAPSE